MMVRIPLRNGVATVEPGTVPGWPAVIYLCGKEACPHYQGQRGLLAGTERMHCALVQYAPDRTCQAYYVEAVEALDREKRDIWDRLAEAEAFERAVRQAEPVQPSAPAEEAA